MIASILMRNEMIKTFKRLAFWVTFVFFAFGTTMNFGESYYRAAGDPDRSFALPDAWRGIVTGDSEVALIFGSVVLLLLLSSEFSWRTARQNVIDGLSKEQFFLGKWMLLPAVGLIFVATQLVIGGGFAFLGTDLGASSEPLIRSVHWSTIGGLFLAFLGYASIALFVSLAVRNSGPAMAIWFFYVALGEQLLAGGLGRISDTLAEWARFLPVNTFNQFHRYYQHDAEAYQNAVLSAVDNGRTPPTEPWAAGVLAVAYLVWIALLVGGAFVWFRRRDL
jgi:ABC-type transport system involved in multi-copper enzyme maturation permease subunit